MPESKLQGRRALVSLGRRKLTGIITGTISKPEISKINKIEELIDDEPVFSDVMMNFCKWMADFYMASIGETFKAALPAGFSPKSILRATAQIGIEDEELELMKNRAPVRAKVLSEIINSGGNITIQAIESRTGISNVRQIIDALEKLNFIHTERIIEKKANPKFEKRVKLTKTFYNTSHKELFDELDNRAPKQSLLLSTIASEQKFADISLTELLKITNSSRSSIEALAEKGLLEIYENEVNRSLLPDGDKLSDKDEIAFSLTDEQINAKAQIINQIEKACFTTFLLHGVTGSGKTLVYLHAISKCLENNKSALMLVPEILLTQQLIDRFERAFPNLVAVLHSKMSEGERYDSWRAIRNGKARIVIGARSAIFAPLDNIGVIIVDEEHEHSYKQQSPAPRYHGRDSAIMLAKLHDCPVVLGSATPSIESKFNASTGKYKELKILNRADNAKVPDIETVDMIDARKHGKVEGSFSSFLIMEIIERIKKREGIILLQNRRGYAPVLECRNCGHIPMCDNCDITLTYHKRKNYIICHYCGFARYASKSCEACTSTDINLLGTGTQKIEEELHEVLESHSTEAVIDRIDLDTVSRKGSLRKKLRDFKTGKTDILVGTQMVAKGLDFDRVTLVGVINSDLQLYIPDFRSAEKTFQLITQVAGRAGRSSIMPGKVIVQSSNPGHYALSKAISKDYDGFYELESKFRKASNYPPYSRFSVIEFSSKDEKSVHQASNEFASFLPKRSEALAVLGPALPKIPRLKGYFRRVIILKSLKKLDASGNYLRRSLQFADEEYKKRYAKSTVKYTIDIDSFSSL